MTDDQGTRHRPPPFSLSIFFFLPSVVLEPPSPPPPPRLPSSLFLFTSTTAVALPDFSIATNHPTTLPSHHRHGSLLSPLLFLSDPPSAFLLFLSSISDLPCSLFFLYCQSLSTGATVAESMVLPAENLRSPFPPYFPSMPPVIVHFFCLRFLLCDAVDVILIVVALLCCGDAFPPPSSSSSSPSAPAPLCHHQRDQIAATTPPHLPPLP